MLAAQCRPRGGSGIRIRIPHFLGAHLVPHTHTDEHQSLGDNLARERRPVLPSTKINQRTIRDDTKFRFLLW